MQPTLFDMSLSASVGANLPDAACPVSACVRAIRGARPGVQMEGILDSGPDLPISLGATGVRGPKAGRISVRDAQGGRLPVNNT